MRATANQGNSGSHFIRGVMYDQGQGVPQDYVEAHKWINLAASRVTGDDYAALQCYGGLVRRDSGLQGVSMGTKKDKLTETVARWRGLR